MTVFLALYYAMLAAWLPLLWPALRLSGRSRVWLLVVATAGLLATLHEFRMMFWTVNPIRLDIFLIAIALGVLYASAAAVMFRNSWRKSAAALLAVLVVAGGGMAYGWIEAGRESARLTEVFHERNALLFEAKFRDFDTYADYFKIFDARPTFFPVGHWEDQGQGYFSRLIVNPTGRVWAFFRCGDTECPYHSAEPGLQTVGDPAGMQWEFVLEPPAGLPVTVRIARPDRDRLTIEGHGQPSTMAETPPPIDPAPARRSLNFLGPFTALDCRGDYTDVRQLWLWQEGTRLYAVGVFGTLLSGRRADYVSPIVMGDSEQSGDGWSFAWSRDGRSGEASIALAGADAHFTLTLTLDRRPEEHAVLSRNAVFHDEAIELAPLTAEADWDHWFDTVMVGHFASGDIPEC